MTRSIAAFGLSLLILFGGCSRKQPSGGEAQEEQSDSAARAEVEIASEADLIFDEPGDSTQVYAAVMTEEGDLIPVALLDRNGYRTAWTTPAYEGTTPPLPAVRFPRRWYLYTPDDAEEGTPVRLRAAYLRQTYCGQNWAFSTDRSLPFAAAGNTETPLLGVAFTVPMSRVSFLEKTTDAKRLESVRISLGLQSNTKEEEASYEFVPLGYFRIGDVEIGVGQSLWYESTEYVLFEIRGREGRIVISADGGGC
jgi:hypothetical protein